MADEGTPTPTPAPEPTPEPTPTPAPEGKTYTQAEMDAITSERDSFKEAGDQLTDLYGNDRFLKFVEEENKRLALGDEEYEKSFGGGTKPASDEPDLESMSEAERIKYYVDEALKPLQQERAQEKYLEKQNTIKSELTALQTDKEKFPMFEKSLPVDGKDIPVRQLMKQELAEAEKRGEDMSLATAYKLVTYEAQREIGQKQADDLLAKKREAASVGIPVSQPGRTAVATTEFKNPREAVEATLTELGL